MSNVIRNIFGGKKKTSGSTRDVGATARPLERVALGRMRGTDTLDPLRVDVDVAGAA